MHYAAKKEIRMISARSFVDSKRGWKSRQMIFVELNSESKIKILQQPEESTNKPRY